eukprot:COSAG06_NODE_2722_length_6385_cov_10.493000_1_plen_98_part_00
MPDKTINCPSSCLETPKPASNSRLPQHQPLFISRFSAVFLFFSCNIAQEISLATASVGAWGRFLNWRTLDSARQFAAAARIGYNATETLSALESVSA